MSARIAFVSVALLVVSGAALSQPQPKPGPAVPPPPANGNLIPPPNVPPAPPAPSPPPLGPTVSPPPREKTVDELLAELEDVQAQKAALEKREQELKTTLRAKLGLQAERLKKLGVTPLVPPPDRVGRIIIEGNAKTPDENVRKLLEFQPGQILVYPGLEAARERLKKYGFIDVSVEVLPSEDHSHFKDVRVKLTEPPEADKR